MTAEDNIIPLVRESSKGSGKAQKQLYSLYARAMFNLCIRMLNNREEAEDILQDAFADAFQSLQDFRGESSFGVWLKRIVVNKCINRLKQKRSADQFTEEITGWEEQEKEEDYNNMDTALMVARIKDAVRRLPDGSRTVFTLYMFEGYDHEEISQVMGISVSTSKTQYMRARQLIRQEINNRYERR